MPGPIVELKKNDVLKTYRYLRIGIVGAVVLLAVSIAIERSKVPCLQTSLSAYYYTPVRAIFVGFLIAICLALIVYKGRSTREDFFLNIAGVLAAVVAVAPTTDVGRCWSIPPESFPVQQDGSLATWVVSNIENNIHALLIIGFIALAFAVITAIGDALGDKDFLADHQQATDEKRQALLRERKQGRWWPTTLSFVLLLVGWVLIEFWDDFDTLAHGWAALLAISCLGFAIISQALYLRPRRRSRSDRRLYRIYWAIVALMALGGIFIWLTRIFDEHTVFYLEAWELGLFVVYWIVETKVKWTEEVVEA